MTHCEGSMQHILTHHQVYICRWPSDVVLACIPNTQHMYLHLLSSLLRLRQVQSKGDQPSNISLVGAVQQTTRSSCKCSTNADVVLIARCCTRNCSDAKQESDQDARLQDRGPHLTYDYVCKLHGSASLCQRNYSNRALRWCAAAVAETCPRSARAGTQPRFFWLLRVNESCRMAEKDATCEISICDAVQPVTNMPSLPLTPRCRSDLRREDGLHALGSQCQRRQC